MKMDSDLLHSPAVGLADEEEADMNDWKLPLAFMKKRHLEKIEGSKALAQSWRMKDRVISPLIYAVCAELWLRVCHGAFSVSKVNAELPRELRCAGFFGTHLCFSL